VTGGATVLRPVDAEGAPSSPYFARAVEVTGARRLLYTSGITPTAGDRVAPEGFEDQARLAWANLLAQLIAAGMTPDNLVKVTVFLADRAHRAAAADIHDAVLAGRRVAVSTVIAGLVDARWLIEIEAVAAD
jgi:enamine deaminase RidA (YjgF/YER057c/UK114 family)